MGNALCQHSCELNSSDAELVQQNAKTTIKNLEMKVQPEILPPWPELHDFQGTFIETSSPGLFEDPDFPATNDSIGEITGDPTNPDMAAHLQEMMKSIVPGWVRPAQMIGKNAGKYKLFATEGEACLFKRVSPFDIKQGYLGNCWLVAAMSTLAEYPDRVRSLFRQQSLSENGRYDLRLYDPIAEEWRLITVDDRLPYWQQPGKHGNLCFANQTKDNEFWPCLLEKAVAKFIMGFYRLDSGFTAVGLEMFTGKPSVFMHLSPVPGGAHTPFHIVTGETAETARHATVYMRKETFDLKWRYWGSLASSLVGGKSEFADDELWIQMHEWDEKGYSQACGSRTNYKGILAGHAYTVLKLVDVPIMRKGPDGKQVKSLKMIHVRNPHATNEWFGPFNDMDWDTWHAFPEALEATGHKVGDKDDGAFWMEWEDFKKGFMNISVCFNAQKKGARYTDDSTAAIHQHHNVEFGTIGYQKWDGLK